MEYLKLKDKMNTLAKEIAYSCKKYDHLVYALKLSTTPGHVFFHSGFEAVGKSLLESIHTHYLFTRGYCTEKEIKKALEAYLKDNTLTKFVNDHEVWKYIYNDDVFASDDKSIVPENSSVDLLERIIGAMYYDSDWQTVKHWVINTLGIRKYKKTGSIQSLD